VVIEAITLEQHAISLDCLPTMGDAMSENRRNERQQTVENPVPEG
jgi:hypothetical protein